MLNVYQPWEPRKDAGIVADYKGLVELKRQIEKALERIHLEREASTDNEASPMLFTHRAFDGANVGYDFKLVFCGDNEVVRELVPDGSYTTDPYLLTTSAINYAIGPLFQRTPEEMEQTYEIKTLVFMKEDPMTISKWRGIGDED
jgi:hypothetical protein